MVNSLFEATIIRG